MSYTKKSVIIKGEAEGIFTMQGGVSDKYSLALTKGSLSGDILLFTEDKLYRLQRSSGILPVPVSSVCAVALGDGLASRGQLKPFNWQRARRLASPKPQIVKQVKQEQPAYMPPAKKQEAPPERVITEEAFPCPVNAYTLKTPPFAGFYPEARWTRHEYPSARGRWHYLTAELIAEGRLAGTLLALPGSSAIRPSGGFNSFKLSEDGRGYWIRINRI